MLAASRARRRGRGRANDRLHGGTHLLAPAPAGPRSACPSDGHQVRLLWQAFVHVWVEAFHEVIWFPTCFAPSTWMAWLTEVLV